MSGRRAVVAVCLTGAGALLAPAVGSAQVVQGRVVEGPAKRPAADVAVRLFRAAPGDTATPSDTASVASGVTAADGVFALFAPGPGTYRVRIGDGHVGPTLTLGTADSTDQREYAVAVDYGAVFVPPRVDKQPSMHGLPPTQYPPGLQAQGVTGCATLRFVVDTSGRADAASVQALAMTHIEFAQAAAQALVRARYTPAERDGRKVRVLVAVPLTFALADRAQPDNAKCVAAARAWNGDNNAVGPTRRTKD